MNSLDALLEKLKVEADEYPTVYSNDRRRKLLFSEATTAAAALRSLQYEYAAANELIRAQAKSCHATADQITALNARVRVLKSVLRPLAALSVPEDHIDDAEDGEYPDERTSNYWMTCGAIRGARTALGESQ